MLSGTKLQCASRGTGSCVRRHEAARGVEMYGVCRPVLRHEGKVSSGITTVLRSICRYLSFHVVHVHDN